MEKRQAAGGGELSWRRRGSQSPSREPETREGRAGDADIRKKRPLFGRGREQRLERAQRIYGEVVPIENELKKLYKESKIVTNKFINWLVEKCFSEGKELPCYVSRVHESVANCRFSFHLPRLYDTHFFYRRREIPSSGQRVPDNGRPVHRQDTVKANPFCHDESFGQGHYSTH